MAPIVVDCFFQNIRENKPMGITREEVIHVAELARLALTEEEIDLYTEQMQKILGYVEKLSAVDTTGVDPSGVCARGECLRDDVITPSLEHEKALQNAPEEARGCFKVPRIIE